MEIRIFQIIVPLICVLFIVSMVIRHSRGRVSLGEMFLTVGFFSAVGAVAIWPDRISNFVAHLFGIESNINAVIFLSIGVLLYLIFRLYTEIRINRQQITDLTRKIALMDAEKEDK